MMVNGKVVSILEWKVADQVAEVPGSGEVTLDVLVENLGRVNYADFQSPVLNNQRKGLS